MQRVSIESSKQKRTFIDNIAMHEQMQLCIETGFVRLCGRSPKRTEEKLSRCALLMLPSPDLSHLKGDPLPAHG